MANYEFSNLQYKGNTYTVKDNSALHQSAIGSWTPDFANLKPLATYEYDIASTSYFKICERPNVTTITDIADEVLAFRITITGTGIFAIADVLVRLQPTVNGAPRATINYQTMSTTAATTGIRYFRIINPKAANTSYKYELAIAAYNTTKRHIKVEVFKAPSEWIFSSAATTYSYNSTYQTATDLTLYTRIGLIGTSTHYMNAAYSDYAAYTSSWMSLFNSNNSGVLVAGAAIAANQLAFVGEDYKVYPVTNTTQPILTAWPIMFVTTAIASGAACTWSYLRTWGYGTPATSVLRDTLAAHDTVYLKCTYMNGKVYSQNRITPTIGAGSNSTDTYYKLGVMYNTTALAFNTLGGVYFTVDMDGNTRAINGYSLNAAKADTATAVSKSGLTSAGTYGVLLDSNQITDIIHTTTSPGVNASLTFNPSTGNLSSTLFTGSGAGLTGIPFDAIQTDDPIEDTDVFLSRTATNGDKKYKSAKLVGGTVAFNQIAVAPSNRTGYGITITRDSEKKTTTVSGTATRVLYVQFDESPLPIVGHVYYASLGNASIPNNTIILYNDNAGVNTGYGQNGETIGKATGAKKFHYRIDATASFSSPVTLTPQIIDLTLMFGNTIADRIYALETATAGAGVAWFKKYFPKDYYPYNTGTLVSACPTGMASSNNIKKDVSYIISPLELNGYPSIDSNDNLVYDGDIRESNGTVTRKWFITKLNGTEDWTARSGNSHTFQLYRDYFNTKYWPKTGTWQVNDTFAYGGWNTYPSTSQIDTIDCIYARNTNSLIVTVMSCSTLAEFQAYLAANPIFMGWHINEFTESTYPFKSPQLVYSGETESFIDDRDVPMPVGQIAEYMDSFDAVEDSALADTGNCELLSNKVTTVDSTSTDNQYPSAKAVYDIVPSKVEYSNTPFVGTCSTAAATTAKTVTVDSSFQLVDGVRVRVYMNNANTNTAPTLNVNGTGAKSIGIQNPYGTVSNVVLSAWHAGAFCRGGWFDFFYAASYNSGNGRWIIEDAPAPIRLANFAASRLSSINSTNGTLVNGGVRYTVVANGATGNPFGGSAAVLWLSHDNTATYTRQIAMSANTPPHMAFRSQDSGGGTNWQPWEYVLTAANQYDSHMATLAYTAAGVAFSNNTLTIPIDGTQYKILQAAVFNNDFNAGSLGYPALFSFNAAGSSGYIIGTTTYCVVRSAASGITLEFDSSWSLLSSTSVDVQVLYRRIS